jgi:hypothetical protein
MVLEKGDSVRHRLFVDFKDAEDLLDFVDALKAPTYIEGDVDSFNKPQGMPRDAEVYKADSIDKRKPCLTFVLSLKPRVTPKLER